MSPHVRARIPDLFPLPLGAHLFISINRSLQLGFFCVCRHERLFLLLEALLGKEGCVAVIYAGLGRFSRRGRGVGEDRVLPAVADPRASPLPYPLPKTFLPHSATRRPAATFLEKDHTCANSSLWRRGELRNRPAFPKLFTSPPVPELARKCCFHLPIALATSIPPTHPCKLSADVLGFFSCLWTCSSQPATNCWV